MPYPVTFEVDYVEERNRMTAFFRLILAIPLFIVVSIYAIAALIAVVIAWFAIVITGQFPAGLYDFVAGFVRTSTRVTAYAGLLVDPYPPFGPAEDRDYPVRVSFAGPPAQYSRARTFFRFILAIPIMIMRYVINALLEIASFAAWFVIVITGKMPRGLFDVMVLAQSYTARSDGYLFLLAENYPPFQDEQTRAAGVAGGVA